LNAASVVEKKRDLKSKKNNVNNFDHLKENHISEKC